MAIEKINYVHLQNGKLAASDTDPYTEADLAGLFRNFREDPNRDQLVVHFHGGLVGFQTAKKYAGLLKTKYEGGKAYPVFFLWESSFTETFLNNLGEFFRELIFRLLFHHLKKEVCGETSKLSLCNEEKILRFQKKLDRDKRLQKEVQKIREGKEKKETKARTLISQKVLDQEINNGAGLVLGKVLHRIAQGRDHGFIATIIEELCRHFYLGELGRVFWDQMKKDTGDAFGEKGGGKLFLEELKKGWQNGHQPRIVLVGHSAGAIYICHWLEAVEKMQFPEDLKFDLIFLAPACTFTFFADTLRKYQNRIANFRLFGLHDQWEQKERTSLYPHSLLYLISGALEDEADEPLVGMERFYTGKAYQDFPAIKQVRDYLTGDWQVWSEDDRGPGKATKAKTHGGIDRDQTTVNSVVWLLLNGYKE